MLYRSGFGVRKGNTMGDVVDRLIAEWEEQCPELDLTGMSVVGRLMHLGSKLESRIETKLKPYGLIYTDFDILATLRRSGGDYSLTPTKLRHSILLTSGAMTAALDRLERNGLIERIRSEQDRRSMSARPTPAGAALAEKVAALRFDDANDAVASLTTKEVHQLAGLLGKLLRSLDQSIPEKDKVEEFAPAK